MNFYLITMWPDGSSSGPIATYDFVDGSGASIDFNYFYLDMTQSLTLSNIISQIVSSATAYASGHGYTIIGTKHSFPTPSTSTIEGTMSATDKAKIDALSTVASSGVYADLTGKPSFATVATTGAYSDLTGTPVTPQSYQTIVSQTGTAAPAASGLTPVNTYSGTPTFTWARTGTGVYTLTAGAAVFNTSGKTGVFITPPQNLNGSFKAVVTSTTVITITTAVQSLAVLGLLGFTATPTDALLVGTMIYVQTYP